MSTRISEEEINQILRTVEMFEAITESQPDDSQSLEILKDAYNKLNRQPDSLRISKKLAGAYVHLGQISQAILEYEGILRESPDDANTRAALTELESKLSRLTPSHPSEAAPSAASSKLRAAASAAPVGPSPVLPRHKASADDELVEMLVAEKIASLEAIQPLLRRLQTERGAALQKGQTLTLVQLLVEGQIATLDNILIALVNRSGLPYLPLSAYDVDHDVACLLSLEICFQHCIIPFDVISRSVLIATANPFDTAAQERVRTMVDYDPIWYVSSPGEITQALRRAYGMDTQTNAENAKPV
jgi:tetratricopeptide (TPR) repeat protein